MATSRNVQQPTKLMTRLVGTGRACLECKAKKIRCLASSQNASACERCHLKQIDCVIPPGRIRQPRIRLRYRIDQLEQSLSGITAVLSASKPLSEPDINTASLPSTAITPSASTEFSSPESPTQSTERQFSCHYHVTIEQAEKMCDGYRQMANNHFPYVMAPEHTGVLQLQQQRPMLLRAMLASSSWRNRSLQLVLEEEYLKELGSRLFIRGEKTLDLLQGLLVYLGWSHFHKNLPNQQFYRLVSIAATILTDLGLHRRPNNRPQRLFKKTNRDSGDPAALKPTNLRTNEEMRAVVGCYILSSLASKICRNMNILAFTEYPEDCAISLAFEKEVPSDSILLYHIHLLRIVDQIYEVYDSGSHETTLEMDGDKVNAITKSFEMQMAAWRANLPPFLSHDVTLNTWFYAVDVFAYERRLFGIASNSQASVSRITTLFDCLSRIKSYFTLIMSLSQEDMESWTYVQWHLLQYGVVTLSNVILAINSIVSTAESTERISKLDSFLQWLCTRVRDIYADESLNQGQNHEVQQWLARWEEIRSSYRQHLSRTATLEHENGPLENMLIESQAPDYGGMNLACLPGSSYTDLFAGDVFWFQDTSVSGPVPNT